MPHGRFSTPRTSFTSQRRYTVPLPPRRVRSSPLRHAEAPAALAWRAAESAGERDRNLTALRQKLQSIPDAFALAPPTPQPHSPLLGQVPAYRRMGEQLLDRAAGEARILGLGAWLQEVCRHQLRSPASERPEAENLVRRLLELQEALRLCDELDGRGFVDVGCDQAKTGAWMHPSSDIAVCDARGRVTRHVEVTSVAEPVRHADALYAAVEHVLRKATHEDDDGTHEGAVALNWAEGADPDRIIQELVGRLNGKRATVTEVVGEMAARLEVAGVAARQALERLADALQRDRGDVTGAARELEARLEGTGFSAHELGRELAFRLRPSNVGFWRRAGRSLDRLTLESYGPTDPPQVYARLVNEGGTWQAEIGPFLPADAVRRA
jgi:hypothetical protein